LEFIRIVLYDLECAQGAFPDAGTAAVAVFFRDKVHRTVCHSARTFHAGPYAFTAAITFVFIDMENFSPYFMVIPSLGFI
jgi:hypothetical protein